MIIIPAIDIIDGKAVRLTKGDYDQKKIYNEDPLAALPGLPEYLQRIKARPLVQKVRGGVKK